MPLLRIAIVFLALQAPPPSSAQEPEQHAVAQTTHNCLDQKERLAESDAHKVVPLVVAMQAAGRRMPGTVVRARLCHGRDGLVYMLTVLAHDGKVARLTVNAVNGALIGGL